MVRLSLLVAASILCAGCDNSGASTTDESSEDRTLDEALDAESVSFDSEEIKGGETYAEYDVRRDSLDGGAGSFGDYGCTEDCSGHEAGAAWAEEKGINDPDDCGGKSWSFEEGCRDYAEEQQSDESEEATE